MSPWVWTATGLSLGSTEQRKTCFPAGIPHSFWMECLGSKLPEGWKSAPHRLLRELYWGEQFLLFPWKATPLPGKVFIWLLSRVLLVRPWRADETEPKTTEASLLCCF